MNQSLDGYVDHMAFAPSPTLFRHFIEEARGRVGMRRRAMAGATLGQPQRASGGRRSRMPLTMAASPQPGLTGELSTEKIWCA